VPADENSNFFEFEKTKTIYVSRYKGYIFIEVGFFEGKYFPSALSIPWFIIFLKFETVYKDQKTAVCIRQTAVFCLTKYLFIRPDTTNNSLEFFVNSKGCRSPPACSSFLKNFEMEDKPYERTGTEICNRCKKRTH
jgi:hypothetical protein